MNIFRALKHHDVNVVRDSSVIHWGKVFIVDRTKIAVEGVENRLSGSSSIFKRDFHAVRFVFISVLHSPNDLLHADE